MNNKTIKPIIIYLILFVAILPLFFISPIAQDINYHLFVDQNSYFNIPNFWNVVSNLPFLIVGLLGLYHLLITTKLKPLQELRLHYFIFYLGIALVAFGSGYYHLWPDNQSLVWDRLPMTIAFMSLFAMIIGEFISIDLGRKFLWPLLTAGALSVVYWQFTELAGRGDLRPYVLVQFLPMILIPVILIKYKDKHSTTGYWLLLLAYVLAKLFEHFDVWIFKILTVVSGHSLKHIVAALGVYLLLHYTSKTNKTL